MLPRKLAAIRPTGLTDNQLEIIADQLAPTLDYFRRIEERMVAQGFDESDRLRYPVPGSLCTRP